jgi:DNA-binding response OmpR family regulator
MRDVILGEVAPLAPMPSARPNAAADVVVVVDDDSDIRAMLVKALGATYTIYEARDGVAARDLLAAIPPPAALVCDITMPRLDGLTLAKELRKNPALSRMPILFLTARVAPLDIIAGINAGARHYVTKPFKLADLVVKVKAMTGAK